MQLICYKVTLKHGHWQCHRPLFILIHVPLIPLLPGHQIPAQQAQEKHLREALGIFDRGITI